MEAESGWRVSREREAVVHSHYLYENGEVYMTGNNKKTILIVEDEADVRNFSKRLLELEGYNIIQAEDGEEGLAIFKNTVVSLVLLDLQLPKLDGWSFLKETRKDPILSKIPVIIFTASAAESKREQALSMGAVEYLAKPLGAAQLKDTVNHFLQNTD